MTLHPEQVLAALKEQSPNPVRHRNLEIIHNVCSELHAQGNADFSIATVGRLSQERGGISKQALYNQTSAYLRDLIKAWASFAAKPTRKPAKSHKPLAEEEWLRRIEDPAARALVGSIIAERNRLRAQIAIQRKSTNIVIDCRPLPGHVTRIQGGELMQVVTTVETLTPMEKTALRKAIDPLFLADQKWEEGPNGEIRNEKKRILFDLGFANAIRKILDEE